MKKKTTNIWSVLYPIVLYYLISSMAFFGMTILFGESDDIYMLKQLVSSGSTIPFLLSLKKQDAYAEEVVFGKIKKWPIVQAVSVGAMVFVAMATFGIALNNFIAMTPLVQISAGFQNVNKSFFGGEVILTILASCVVVPIAEELLFRGVILKRCSVMVGERLGIIFSALLFGVIHVNIVQFLYAAVLGLLLAVFVCKTRRVWVAVLGHAAANLMAILRAETGLFNYAYKADWAGIVFSLCMVVIGAVATELCLERCKSLMTKE